MIKGVCVSLEYVIWIATLFLLVFGWLRFNHFYRHQRTYFVPYIIFQIGVTLFAISIFIIGGWDGMGLGIVAIMMIGVGVLIALLIYIIHFIKSKEQ